MNAKRLSPGNTAKIFATEDMFGNSVDLDTFCGSPLLLCFFRYASCPLCNLRVQELIRSYESLHASGLNILAVFQSPADKMAKYVGQQKPPFPLIPDPQAKLYRLYGVESSWGGFFRAWSIGLPKVFKAVIGKRFIPGSMEGDIHRIPADFLIDPAGIVIDVHYGIDIGDHMPLERVTAWLSGYNDTKQ